MRSSDVQPVRSIDDLRAVVGRRAKAIRRRERVATALVASTALLVGTIGAVAATTRHGARVDVSTVGPGSQRLRLETRPGDDERTDAAAGGGATSTTQRGAVAAAPASPAPKRGDGIIVFSSNRSNRSENFDLYTVRPDGSGLRLLTRNGVDPAVSPDGKVVAFVRCGSCKQQQIEQQPFVGTSPNPGLNDASAYLVVINIDGTGERRLQMTPAAASRPAWSPDGQSLAYVSRGGYQIVVARLDDGNARQVTTGPGTPSFEPAWSPDGREIAYTSTLERDNFQHLGVFVVDLGTGATRAIATDDASEPSWSPDGKSLAFGKIVGGTRQIFVAARDGSHHRLLFGSNGWSSAPTWARDGRRLVFDHDPDGHDEPRTCDKQLRGTSVVDVCTPPGSNGPAPSSLWIVGADGSDAHQLTQSTAVDEDAWWSP